MQTNMDVEKGDSIGMEIVIKVTATATCLKLADVANRWPLEVESDHALVHVSQDLNFTVVSKKKDIKLLQSLTAKFPGSQLTALMGPSGSGKTTLLGSPPSSLLFLYTLNSGL